MRLFLLPLLFAFIALPADAQQLSPLTGTTASPPTVPASGPLRGTAPATANPARRPRMSAHERFVAANTTNDGKLTQAQAQAGRMPRVAKNFDAIDSAHHGYVTEDDIVAYTRAQRAARKAGRPAQ